MNIDKKIHKNDHTDEDDSVRSTRNQSMGWQVMKRMAWNKGAIIGLAILVVIVLASFIGPLFCKYGVNEMNLSERFNGPSFSHLFGTDGYGRDIFVRILYGGRFSLLLGLSGALFGLFVGVVLGLINGYIGGTYDIVFMRIVDIWASIPGLLLAITISTVLGPGFLNTIIALSIGSVPLIIRLLRGQILSVRHEEYLEAATSINAGPLRIMFKHMLPNVVAPVIVNTTMGIGSIINEAAALSYLGLGIQPPNPEWGAMLSAGKSYIQFYPWLLLFPGCAIALVVLCLNLFGDGLRDSIDPKLKR
jgi:ABC-type dipeptide/oligopeptide/nickel transport system permease subunit